MYCKCSSKGYVSKHFQILQNHIQPTPHSLKQTQCIQTYICMDYVLIAKFPPVWSVIAYMLTLLYTVLHRTAHLHCLITQASNIDHSLSGSDQIVHWLTGWVVEFGSPATMINDYYMVLYASLSCLRVPLSALGDTHFVLLNSIGEFPVKIWLSK